MSITVKQGDLFPDVEATVKDENGNVVDVTGASVACYIGDSRDPTNIILSGGAGVVVNGPTGDIAYRWSSGETDVDAGTYEAEFYVTPVVGDAYRVPTSGYITVYIERKIGA